MSDDTPLAIPHPADGEAHTPIFEEVVRKLSPDRIRSSGRLTAIVAYLLGQHGWTDPEINWMSITSEGFVTTDSDFIGSKEDLDRNLREFAEAAGLTRAERAVFLHRRDICIDDHSRRRVDPGSRGLS